MNEEFESRPAAAQEAQRYLPAMESTLQVGPTAPLLDQAEAAQASEHAEVSDENEGPVPRELDDGDGLSDPSSNETPAQRSVREAGQARLARRAAGKKRGRKRMG